MIARRPCCWRAEIADGASHDGNCARGIREEGAFGQEGLHPLGKRVRQAAGPAGRCGPQGPVGQGWRPTAPQDHAGRRKEERRRDEALSPARASEATVRSRGRHGRCAPPWPLADRSPEKGEGAKPAKCRTCHGLPARCSRSPPHPYHVSRAPARFSAHVSSARASRAAHAGAEREGKKKKMDLRSVDLRTSSMLRRHSTGELQARGHDRPEWV